jgi:hypothetical protein
MSKHLITAQTCNEVSNAILGLGPKVSKEAYKAHVPVYVLPSGQLRQGVMAAALMVAVFEAQTPEEQAIACTKELNKVGFNAHDAKILTARAKRVIARGLQSLRRSDYQLLLKLMPKYKGQIERLGLQS